MENYKNALAEKPCRYWDYGKGDCPFNEHCFYKHTDEQGVLMPPKPKPKYDIFHESLVKKQK